MKYKEKQIKEMPICVNCVHAYVCEEYNLDRDMLRKRCAYHNDHFLDIEQYKKKVCKDTAEKILNKLNNLIKNNEDFGRGVFGWKTEEILMLLKIYADKQGVEIKE